MTIVNFFFLYNMQTQQLTAFSFLYLLFKKTRHISRQIIAPYVCIFHDNKFNSKNKTMGASNANKCLSKGHVVGVTTFCLRQSADGVLLLCVWKKMFDRFLPGAYDVFKLIFFYIVGCGTRNSVSNEEIKLYRTLKMQLRRQFRY